MRKIPAHVREQQINALPDITFVRWDGDYRNQYSKAVCRCDVDSFEWSASASELIRGKGCPQCAGKRRWTANERIEQISSLPNVIFVRWSDGDYRNCYSKAVCRCTIDGYEWSPSVNDLINNCNGCPQCAGNLHLTTDVRERQINNLPNITFVRWDGEYHNQHSKAICRCNLDGYEWSASVTHLTNQRSGCPQCSGKRRWTAAERVKQINDLPNTIFVRWDGEYRNAFSKAVCHCGEGHEWYARVNDLINNGNGCPHCAEYGYNPSKPGTLYALRSECGTMVKIGISNNHEQRHRQLARATPFEWSCVELLHGDGTLIASLEKAFHGLTEPAVFKEAFDGYTEWRKWDPRVSEWFDNWRGMI